MLARLVFSVGRSCRSSSSKTAANPLHLRLIVSDSCALCGRFAASLDLYAKTITETRSITYDKVNIKTLPEVDREKHQYDVPVLLDDEGNLLNDSMSCQSGGRPTRVVVLHGGVSFREGKHAVDACKKAMKYSEDAVEAVENLELGGAFNAGAGSSLTREGTVEMEAAVCRVEEGGELLFGAVGASALLASPVRVAEALAESTRETSDGLIDPLVLVGEGAERWARDNDLDVLSDPVVSAHAEKEWKRAMERVNGSTTDISDAPRVMDTVGAVDFVLDDWHSSAVCSSGGVILKRPGRLGHCTSFGAGVWVEQREWMEGDSSACRRSVSLTLTGCGEAIVRVDAARTLARRIAQRPDSMQIPSVIASFYSTDFNGENGLLRRVNPAHLYMGGIAIVREEKRRKDESSEDDSDDDSLDSIEVVVFHNTPFLPVAWRDEKGRVKGMMSRREEGREGVQITVLPL